jgi:hypothetical protein
MDQGAMKGAMIQSKSDRSGAMEGVTDQEASDRSGSKGWINE